MSNRMRGIFGSLWDILVSLACLPEVADAFYGFHSSRRGGAQSKNPTGAYNWPMSQYINCCTWGAYALTMAGFLLGKLKAPMDQTLWRKAMIENIGDPGLPEVAVALGLAKQVENNFGEIKAGDWWACQGWNGNAGHTFFIKAMTRDGVTGLVYLESNGQPKGGSWNGIDGVGSRNVIDPAKRSSRTWTPGEMPEVQPYTVAKVEGTYKKLFVAKLAA